MGTTTLSGPVVSTNGFVGAVTGNVTGNVTGDVVGSITGAVTNSTITAATAAPTAAQSGTTFFLSKADGIAVTLPAPAAGLRYTFIVKTAPTSGTTSIVTTSSANIIKGQQYVAADAAGDTGTADDTITFVANQAVAGDRVELISDGTSWFAYAFSAVAAGITFTQAS